MKNQNIQGDTLLIPFSEFKQAAKGILSVTKEESDKQLAEFQKK